MAKIKFGALMVDARGKLGGHVFSKNRGGSYIRTKVTPSNPQTVDQQTNRALLGFLATQWSILSENDRNTWNSAVDSWKTTNIFGDSINPSGKSLFTMLNKNLLSVGNTMVNEAPEKVQMAVIGLTSCMFDISTATLGPVFTGNLDDFSIVLSATPSLTQGTKFVKNRLRQIYKVSGAAFTEAGAYSAYIAKFGSPVPGANIHISLKVIASNGQMSVAENVKALVVA